MSSSELLSLVLDERQIAAMCHIACWFHSGAVLKFDQFLSLKLLLNEL